MQQERFEPFTVLITGIHRDIQKLKHHYTRDMGLKTVHAFWLYLLRTHPEGLSASQLAQYGRSTRALVSREIDELVQGGLITTPEHSEKRRYGWRFVLTDAGRQKADRIAHIAMQVQRGVSADIPQEDLQVFYRTLDTLSANFDRLVQQDEKGEFL